MAKKKTIKKRSTKKVSSTPLTFKILRRSNSSHEDYTFSNVLWNITYAALILGGISAAVFIYLQSV